MSWQRACRAAGLLVLVVAAAGSQGCVAFTYHTWTEGQYEPWPDQLENVRMSDEGDVCVVYTADLRKHRQTIGTVRRYVLVPSDVVDRLANKHGIERDHIRGRDLEGFVHPRDPRAADFGGRRLARKTRGWRQVPQSGKGTMVDIPYGGRQVSMSMPWQEGIAWRSIPVRVILTPPALVVDILTAPFQLMLFSALRGI